MTRLAVFATHPVQYHVPLWRALARHPEVDLTVHYFSDHSIRGTVDPGFARPVGWDIPLLEGYRSTFFRRDANLAQPRSVRMDNADQVLGQPGFDWVLIQGYTHAFERQIIRAARRLGIRVLMRGEFADHGVQRPLARRVLRDLYLDWFYRHVDAFCYIGETARAHLARRGIAEDRLFFSPYSVDSELFEQQYQLYDRAAMRQLLGLRPSDGVILFSGKLIPRKDPLLILRAIEDLDCREGVALIVMGDGPLADEVRARGTSLLGSRFHFAGFVNQSRLGKYYRAADVLVLPSHYETWGLVVNEAMQFGLPVIVSSNAGCHPDLALDQQTGLTFPAGDHRALADRLRTLLVNVEFREQLGRNARAHIGQYSTAASVAGICQALGVGKP